jgi:hypothetical protein
MEFAVRFRSHKNLLIYTKQSAILHERHGTFGVDIKNLAGCEALWLYKSL